MTKEVDDIVANIEKESKAVVVESSTNLPDVQSGNAYTGIKAAVIDKINDPKNIEKHARRLSKASNEYIKAEIEEKAVEAYEKVAHNKIDRARIRNELYIIKQQHRRDVAQQRHLNKKQRELHKAEINEARMKKYGKKLNKMGYQYVPPLPILFILLRLHDIAEFFEGVATVSDKLVKALKYVLIFIAVIIAVLIVPVTRIWLLEILGFLK